MKTYLLSTSLVLGLAASASASLVFEENFDYGTGGTGTAAGSANAILGANGFTVSGGFMNLFNVGTNGLATQNITPFGAYEGQFLNLGGNGSSAEKNFASALANDTEYFFSFNFNTTNTSNAYVSFQEESGQSLRVGVTAGQFGVGYGDTTDSTTQTAVVTNADYFISGSFIVGSDNSWTINANLYNNVASIDLTEPASWTYTATVAGGAGQVEEVLFNATGGTGAGDFDRVLVGTTYASVVPEPSSYALLAGFLALGWIMVRRRSA